MIQEKGECYLEAPAGEESWSALFRAGRYRDETAAAVRLGHLRGRFLLTGEAGSGKTILLSTLDTLFRNGASAFEGLAAGERWKDAGRYRVLTLDFARLYVATDDESIDIVAEGLRALLTENLARLGLRAAEGARWDELLTKTLSDAALSSVVILIDNLDRPYLEALSDSELLRNVERHLSRLVEIIEAMREKCRFVLMTRETALGPAGVESSGLFREIALKDLA